MQGSGLRLAFDSLTANYGCVLMICPPVANAFRFIPYGDLYYFVQGLSQATVETSLVALEDAGLRPPIAGNFVIVGNPPASFRLDRHATPLPGA